MRRLIAAAVLVGVIACHAPVPAPQPPPVPPPAPPAPVYSDTGERGGVRVDGLRFIRDDGSTFAWRGIDGFRLYEQWLIGRIGITPTVEDWVTCGGLCAAGQGPNVVRVLGMVDSFAHLWPQEHADYYEQLAPFVDYLWNTWHLRVEFVIFADAQIIMPDNQAERVHATKVIEQLAGKPNVFIEISNEPFKNIPGGGQAATDIGRMLQSRLWIVNGTPVALNLPLASGDYDDPANTALNYVTVHTDRGPEWPRKAKDLLDYREMFNHAVVGDEPIGAAEVEKPGSRSASADDFAQFAATCQLFVSGCTFHSDNGIDFNRFEPIQRQLAAAFFQAMHFIPADAQFADYRRGGEQPGCHWVGGESLVEHDDARELRTFGKQIGSSAWVVQIRTNRSEPIACGGWRVLTVARPGLIQVTQ